MRNVLIATAGAGALVGVIVVASVMSRPPAPVAQPTLTPSPTAPRASATPTPAATPAASPTASALGAGAFENKTLGYRVTLPEGYRRGSTSIRTGEETLGLDLYTKVTEHAQREACERDAGHIGPMFGPEQMLDLEVGVYRNSRGLSAMDWAMTPHVPGGATPSHHNKVEPTTVGGREAVRLVSDNAAAVTNAFIVRANDRIYWLRPSFGPPEKTWLDDIAKTFVAIEPAPFPSPTPTVAPRIAAQQVADGLARAFAAKDVDAIARLMPDCWIGVVYAVDGTVPGQGPSNRAVVSFTQGLRDRFARGDLTVTVDPTLQVRTDAGGDSFHVVSQWREPDVTRRVDLSIRQQIDRLAWSGATVYFTRAEMGSGCAPYRVPFSRTGSC